MRLTLLLAALCGALIIGAFTEYEHGIEETQYQISVSRSQLQADVQHSRLQLNTLRSQLRRLNQRSG